MEYLLKRSEYCTDLNKTFITSTSTHMGLRFHKVWLLKFLSFLRSRWESLFLNRDQKRTNGIAHWKFSMRIFSPHVFRWILGKLKQSRKIFFFYFIGLYRPGESRKWRSTKWHPSNRFLTNLKKKVNWNIWEISPEVDFNIA